MENSTRHLILFLQHALNKRELKHLLFEKQTFFKDRLLRKGYRFQDGQFVGYFRLTDEDEKVLRQYEEVSYLCEGICGRWADDYGQDHRFLEIRKEFERTVPASLYEMEQALVY